MNRSEIHKNYLKVAEERLVLEEKIESFIKNWEEGNSSLSSSTIQQIIDKAYERLQELKNLEEKLNTEYWAQIQKEEDKKMADISVHHNLGEKPTNIEIVDGVLSSNANESHLIGKQKTPEQLEDERTKLLSDIKSKVMNHEISLAEASKLTNDVNTAYDFYNDSSEVLSDDNNQMHM